MGAWFLNVEAKAKFAEMVHKKCDNITFALVSVFWFGFTFSLVGLFVRSKVRSQSFCPSQYRCTYFSVFSLLISIFVYYSISISNKPIVKHQPFDRNALTRV